MFFSQSLHPTIEIDNQKIISSLIPVSPNFSQFEVYGNTKNIDFSGGNSLTIPLLHLNEDGLNIDINLNYYSNGTKLDEIASWVGLGWSVSDLGQIKRIVKGKPDDYLFDNKGYTKLRDIDNILYENIVDFSNLDQYQRYLSLFKKNENDQTELENDYYSININGVNTIALIDYNHHRVICLNKPEWKVRYIEDDYNNIISWIIIDEKGVEYKFEEREITDYEGTTVIAGLPYDMSNRYISGWYITSIKTPKRIISVDYQNVVQLIDFESNKQDIVQITDKKELKARYICIGGLVSRVPPVEFSVYNFSVTHSPYYRIKTTNKYINQIITKDNSNEIINEISFYTKSDYRRDKKDLFALSSIEMTEKRHKKNINFYTSYFGNDYDSEDVKRLKLDSISISFSKGRLTNDISDQTYQFIYYDNFQQNAKRKSYNSDYWGYYNNSNNDGIGAVVPKDFSFIPGYRTANREINTEATISGMLKSIVYPTKGRTDFYYEQNYLNSLESTIEVDRTFQDYLDGGYQFPDSATPTSVCLNDETHTIDNVSYNSFYVEKDTYGVLKIDEIRLNDNISQDSQFSTHFVGFFPYVSPEEECFIHNGVQRCQTPWTFCDILQNSQICLPLTENYDPITLKMGYNKGVFFKKGYYKSIVVNNIKNTTYGYSLILKKVATERKLGYVGGVRIREIIDYDHSNIKTLTKKYIYDDVTKTKDFVNSHLIGNGRLQNAPSFERIYTHADGCYEVKTYLYSSNNNNDFNYFPITYDNITEVVYNANITKSYKVTGFFNFSYDDNDLANINIPQQGRKQYEKFYDNSLQLLKTKDYSYTFTLINENFSVFNYLMYQNKTTSDVAYIVKKNDEGKYYISLLRPKYIEIRVGFGCSNEANGELLTNCTAPTYISDSEYELFFKFNNSELFSHILNSKIYGIANKYTHINEIDYFKNGNNLIISENNYYQDTNKLSSEKTTFPDNSVQEATYQYAHEKGNQYLIDKNMIGIPLQTTVTKTTNGVTKTLSDVETKYPATQTEADSKTTGLALPYEVWSKDFQGNTSKEVLYKNYDDKGNLREYVLKPDTNGNGISVTLIYGYNNTQPIAKIEGAKYDDIKTLQTIIDAVSASNSDIDQTSETTLIGKLDLLRKDNSLSNYQITTYTYDPLIGVTSITPPSGIREIYQYDSANRLEKVVDVNGNILKEYQYNYKQ